jgi:hypothetical protein
MTIRTKFILLFILIAGGSQLMAQPSEQFYMHMEGQINGSIKLVADLVRVQDEINGTYYYYYFDQEGPDAKAHYGKTMPLSGSIDANGHVELTEYQYNGNGAVNTGTFTEPTKIEGVWQNAKNSK